MSVIPEVVSKELYSGKYNDAPLPLSPTVTLSRKDFNYLIDIQYRLSKIDRTYKMKIFNDDGQVIGFQG